MFNSAYKKNYICVFMSLALDTKIEFLKGVGPSKAEALKSELGIHTVADLLSHYPFRHEDRSKIFLVKELICWQSFLNLLFRVINNIASCSCNPEQQRRITIRFRLLNYYPL